MNVKHLITFVLVAMIIQYLLCISEWDTYLDMITDIQGYKYNFYKNEKKQFICKSLFAYTVLYAAFITVYYYYTVIENRSYTYSFILASFFYIFWDSSIFMCFDKGVYHYPVLLYDTFIVGGVGLTSAIYIVKNYYNTLNRYIPLLFVLYILSMLSFLYVSYSYNPSAFTFLDMLTMRFI